MRTLFGFIIACAVIVASAGAAFGQASEAEMRMFPMPPPQGYDQTKSFAYGGDYGYYLVPSSSSFGTGANAGDYRYVSYSGVAGKDVWIYGAWGTTPIPAPSGGGDACDHAHASYGVWARYEHRFAFVTLRGWIFAGGGGMSGVRDGAGRCVLSVTNPLSMIDSRFGWGSQYLHFDLRSSDFIKELVVGVLSDTHGWGSCTLPLGQTFPACHEPSWAIAYTLPGSAAPRTTRGDQARTSRAAAGGPSPAVPPALSEGLTEKRGALAAEPSSRDAAGRLAQLALRQAPRR
jgi:hypothetical protein